MFLIHVCVSVFTNSCCCHSEVNHVTPAILGGAKIKQFNLSGTKRASRNQRSKVTSPLLNVAPPACCLHKGPKNLYLCWCTHTHTQHPARLGGPANRLLPAKHMGGENGSPGSLRGKNIQPDMIARAPGEREEPHTVRKIHSCTRRGGRRELSISSLSLVLTHTHTRSPLDG